MLGTTTAFIMVACMSHASGLLLAGPGMPGFPGGDPSHQQQNGFQAKLCVTSPRDCPCSTVYFPMNGCYYCSCLDLHSTVTPTSTTSPTPSSTLTPTVKPPITSALTTVTMKPMTSSVTSSATDYCSVAKNLCQKSCPGGYLVDPSDCTFCVCKSDLIG